MSVSVVIPTRNNSRSLERCIISIKNQAKKPGEIIIVSPKGDDAQRTARKYRCRWVEDRANTIGNAYNIGAAAAKGGIVAFTDDDCVVPRGWLNDVENSMGDADVTGGDDVIDRKKSTDFQNAVFAIDEARPGRVMHGRDAAGRIRACNMAVRKSVLKKHSFDRSLTGLQEPELLHRLSRKGYRIKFIPSIKVLHTRRKDLAGVFDQIYRNGIAKIDLLKIHGDMLSWYDSAVFLGTLATLILVAHATVNPMPLAAWLALSAAYFILKPFYILLKAGKLRYYPLLLQIVFVREAAYGLGLLHGVFSRASK